MSKKKEILAKIAKLEQKYESNKKIQPGNNADIRAHHGYSAEQAGIRREIDELEEKMNAKTGAKANNKSLKGDKMSSTVKNTPAVEVEIIDSEVIEHNFQDYKKRYDEISTDISETSKNLAAKVQVGKMKESDAVNKFTEVYQEMNELNKPQTIAGNMLSMGKSLPMVGGYFEDAYNKTVQEYLGTKSVQEILEGIVSSMEKSSDEVGEVVGMFEELGNEAKLKVIKTEELMVEIEEILQSEDLGSAEETNFKRMFVRLTKKRDSLLKEISNLKNTEIATQQVSIQIAENTPATVSELQNKLIMSATIQKSLKSLEQFQIMVKTANQLSADIDKGTYKTLIKIKEIEEDLEVGDEKQAKKDAIEVEKLKVEYLTKTQNQNERVEKAYLIQSNDFKSSNLIENKKEA